jgi:hypothetical protein
MSPGLAQLALAAFLATAACAPILLHGDNGARGTHRSDASLRLHIGTSLPPGVDLDNGLSPDEAVAVALWNIRKSSSS